jgi:hypothetical protein
VSPAAAQISESDRPPLASYVSSTDADKRHTAVTPLRDADRRQVAALSETTSRELTTGRQGLTEGERWEKFENEFGIQKRDPGFVKGHLESAKYGLDEAAFTMREWTDNIEGALAFDYGVGAPETPWNSAATPRVNDPNPLWNALENVRIKSDINLDPLSLRAFVGVKLVLPFGD